MKTQLTIRPDASLHSMNISSAEQATQSSDPNIQISLSALHSMTSHSLLSSHNFEASARSVLNTLTRNTETDVTTQLLNEWEQEDPSNRRESKEIFLNWIKNQLKVTNPCISYALSLDSQPITSLPEIFHLEPFKSQLVYLDLGNTPLQSLPVSFASLNALDRLNLRGCELQSLSESFDRLKNLKKVSLSENLLESLLSEWEKQDPNNRVEAKEIILNCFRNKWTLLDLSDLPINSLPNIFFIEPFNNLTTMDLSGTLIESLPNSFRNLKHLIHLNLSDTLFQFFPEFFEELTSLKTFYADETSIQSLPNSIGFLRELTILHLSNTNLKSIPECLKSLSHLAFLHLDNTSLQSIPRSIFNGQDSVSSVIRTSFEEALPLRYHLQRIYNFMDQAPPLYLNSLVENPKIKNHLENWIIRLKEIEPSNEEKLTAFYKCVAAILQMAAEDSDYRGVFKSVIREATSTCGDRIILSMLHLGIQRKLKTLDLDDIATVLEFLKKGIWAMSLLEESAASKIEELKNTIRANLILKGVPENKFEKRFRKAVRKKIDPVEIYLGFPIKLKTKLGLPLDVDTMLYFRCSDITQNDLDQTENYITEQLNNEESYFNFLVDNTTWQEVLRRRFSTQMKSLKTEMTHARDFDKGARSFREGLWKLTILLLQITEETKSNEPIAKRTRTSNLLAF
jgi:Leucine-rich repeat (LRR) protein